ncbi:MAG: glycosyl hydrolase family 28-related protein, partial [Candidatus Kapabacteria bacterium]|nr:glycosyl hydrolase family 28-related protein [Candidatus Kapabacteria bacterium]
MNLKIIILLLTYSLLNSKIDSSRFEKWNLAGLTNAYNNIKDTVRINALDLGIINDGIFNNSPTLNSIISNKLQYSAKQNLLLEIYFPIGKYKFNSTINLSSNVSLKGESSIETQFIFDMGGSAINCINISGSPNSKFDTLRNNLGRGNEVISSQLFTLGDLVLSWIEILQDNGSWNTNPADWDKNAIGQIEQVIDFKSNSSFVFNSRIKFDTLLNARFRIIKPIENVSIECVSIERLDEPKSGAGYNIYLGYAVNCKISGIESNKSVGSHCMIEASANNYVCNSYFHDAFTYDGTGTRGYGVTLGYHCNLNLIENNVFKHLRHAMMVKQGANANVFAYNYSLEPNRSEPIADFSGDISLHGHYPFGNLFEGNICQNIIIDHF